MRLFVSLISFVFSFQVLAQDVALKCWDSNQGLYGPGEVYAASSSAEVPTVVNIDGTEYSSQSHWEMKLGPQGCATLDKPAHCTDSFQIADGSILGLNLEVIEKTAQGGEMMAGFLSSVLTTEHHIEVICIRQ